MRIRHSAVWLKNQQKIIKNRSGNNPFLDGMNIRCLRHEQQALSAVAVAKIIDSCYSTECGELEKRASR